MAAFVIGTEYGGLSMNGEARVATVALKSQQEDHGENAFSRLL
jgi:hypothetical protein